MQGKARAVCVKSLGVLCKEEGLQKCSGSPGYVYQSQDLLTTQAEAEKKLKEWQNRFYYVVSKIKL